MVDIDSAHLLSHRISGSLKITIHNRAGETYEWILSLRQQTLFTYIGEACGRIFTNLSTRLEIQTRPEDWRILLFSPSGDKIGILEAQQIGGKNLAIELDDPNKLAHQFDIDMGLGEE